MKRLVYYTALLACAAFAMFSCTDELRETISLDEEETVCEEKTKLEFALDFGEESVRTKALTENAQIKNIYVSVFDGSGYKLSEYVEAVPNSKAGNNDAKYYYSVELTVADTTRILHIIANAPEKLDYGSENSVIGSLYTDLNSTDTGFDFKESYWARLELPNIPKKPEADDPNYSTKMAAYNNVLEKLNGVKLIRNYSKVTATATAGNFDLKGFWFVNYPDRGTVAPYNRNTGKFMDNYLNFTSSAAMEGTGDNQGNYQGFMLATTEFKTPETFDETAAGGYCAAASGKATGYVYEREKALSSPMYLIVKGDYTDTGGTSTTCYYKIAMQDGVGEFYAMLRNFNYLIDIQSVARKGKATAAEALQDVPSGDISVNVDLKDLTNISDGEARITVSATTVMLVGEVGDEFTYEDFWYKYEPDIDEHSGTACNGTSTDNPSYYVTIDGSSYGESGPVFSSFERKSADTGANRYMTLETNAITSVPKHQTLVITGHSISGTGAATKDNKITRNVDFILRPYLTMKLKCGPNTDSNGNAYVEEGKDKPVNLSIGIESGLPASIFPLEFSIEAKNMTLTPNNDNLPARTGLSTIEGVDRSSFWFIKTVTWDEYQSVTADEEGNKYFDCHLKANTTVSATDIYVSQQYFAQNKVALYNYEPDTFSNLALSSSILTIGDPVDGKTDLSFTMSAVPSDGKVLIAMSKFEPTVASSMTYVKTITDGADSYDIYEMSVSSTTVSSVGLTAFQKGTGKVKLSAYKFTDSNVISATLRDGIIRMYADLTGSTAATDFVTGLPYTYKGTGGYPVVGQSCTLTVYLEGDFSNVTIGGSAATKQSGTYTDGDGITYTPYRVTGLNAGTTRQTRSLDVKVDGATVGTVDLKVYGLSLGTSLTSASFDTGKYYAIKNRSTNNYLNNGNANNSITMSGDLISTALWQFSGTGTPYKIISTGTDTNRYIRVNSDGDEIRFSDSNSRNSWNFDYNSDRFRLTNTTNTTDSIYYLIDNGTNAAINNNGNRNWLIYPVNIVAP